MYEENFKLTTIHRCSDLDLQWKPSNPAMSTCIGYGNNAKIADFNTFCERRLPNTLIIGVWKCGTQALLNFLAQHPQVVRNMDIFEYYFFSKYYTNGVEWYRDRMPCSLPGQIVLDCSPNYFADKDVPRRIYNFNPNVRLLLSVRNPVDQVVSVYTMKRMFHDEQNQTVNGVRPGDTFPPFESVWKNYSLLYYDESLDNWLKYFKLDQIHIIDGDMLRKSPLQELTRKI